MRVWLATLAVVLGGCLLDVRGLGTEGGGGDTNAPDRQPSTVGAGGATATAGAGGAGGTSGTAATTTTTTTGGGGMGGNAPDPCGNSTIDNGEECDDGNTTSGDGCSDQCTVECRGPDDHLRAGTLHCYRVISNGLRTWNQGRSDCQALGPGWDLATIVDEAERNYVDDAVDPAFGNSFQNDDPYQYWLLGRDVTQTDTFEWLNGETWGYTPWDDDPQDPSNGNQDCIRLRAKGGSSNDVFRDAECSLTSSSLCERPPAGTSL
jgi:cysteine-rich repeat protein